MEIYCSQEAGRLRSKRWHIGCPESARALVHSQRPLALSSCGTRVRQLSGVSNDRALIQVMKAPPSYISTCEFEGTYKHSACSRTGEALGLSRSGLWAWFTASFGFPLFLTPSLCTLTRHIPVQRDRNTFSLSGQEHQDGPSVRSKRVSQCWTQFPVCSTNQGLQLISDSSSAALCFCFPGLCLPLSASHQELISSLSVP